MKREHSAEEEGSTTDGHKDRSGLRDSARVRSGGSRSWLLPIIRSVPLLAIALVVSGTKACREDYAVGGQASVPSGTATATPTADGGGDDDATGTVTPSPTPDGRATPTRTVTQTATATATALNRPLSGSSSSGLFQELSALSERAPDRSGALARGGVAAGQKQVADGNWLGRAFGGGAKGGSDNGSEAWSDSDNDGYDDRLEQQQGSRTDDSESVPAGVVVTQLDQRVELLDIEDRGVSPQGADGDGDGLSDRFERAIGSDPKRIDSDGDGISDGKEVDLGSDPVVAEPQRESEGR